jgi:hypothetical protein
MLGKIKGGTVHSLVEAGELNRYLIRNSLFRARDKRVEPGTEVLVQAILSVFQDQLKRKESLETFTFNWDVHPTKILDVIRPQDWVIIKSRVHPKAYANRQRVAVEERLFTFQMPDTTGFQPNYRKHLEAGLRLLQQEVLKILKLPVDQELLALVNEETRKQEETTLFRRKVRQAEVTKAEEELADLMAAAQNRRALGEDISDIINRMTVVSAKLKGTVT